MSESKRPRLATHAQVRRFLAAAGYEGTAPDDLVATYVDLLSALRGGPVLRGIAWPST